MTKTRMQDWKEQEFLPWKSRMEAYVAEKNAQLAKLREHAPQLQTIVAMLVDGRTKQAVLAWNTLQLHPKLKDIRVSGDGETLTLVTTDGTPNVLKLDELLADLQQVLQRQG